MGVWIDHLVLLLHEKDILTHEGVLTHEKKPNGIDEAGSSRSGVCEKVGKHKYVECRICLKTMRGDNLVRHMKTHEKKTCSIDDVNEKKEYHSTIDDIALENTIMRCSN